MAMPHLWADLLPQMPHPGGDKVVKCPTNGGGGGGACAQLELTEPLKYVILSKPPPPPSLFILGLNRAFTVPHHMPTT